MRHTACGTTIHLRLAEIWKESEEEGDGGRWAKGEGQQRLLNFPFHWIAILMLEMQGLNDK